MPEDYRDLEDLGLRKVIVIAPECWNEKLFQTEKDWLKTRKIELESIPAPGKGVDIRTYFSTIFPRVKANTLIHCAYGESSKLFAVYYWIRKGLTPPESLARVSESIQKVTGYPFGFSNRMRKISQDRLLHQVMQLPLHPTRRRRGGSRLSSFRRVRSRLVRPKSR